MTMPQPRDTTDRANGSAEPRPTSLTLLQRLRADDPAAWNDTVRLYTPLVYRWCARSGVHGADAEDVVQEVFRAASTGLKNFRRERPGDTFRGWLRGITRNMVWLHYRRSGRQPPASGGTEAFVQLQDVPDTAAEDPDGEEAAEVNTLLQRALEFVRDRFQEHTWRAFWLTVVDGRSPQDVAPELGMSPAGVRVAKSRVLHRLKEEFGELVQ